MARAWVLNDLFVSPDARQSGVASALMERAEILARRTKAAYLVLETADTNRKAQALRATRMDARTRIPALHVSRDLIVQASAVPRHGLRDRQLDRCWRKRPEDALELVGVQDPGSLPLVELARHFADDRREPTGNGHRQPAVGAGGDWPIGRKAANRRNSRPRDGRGSGEVPPHPKTARRCLT